MDRADAVIEISEWVEVPRKNLTVDDSNSTAANVSAESSPKNTTEDSDDKLDVEGASSDSSNSTANNSSTADLGAEKKLKKRTFRIPLKVIYSSHLRELIIFILHPIFGTVLTTLSHNNILVVIS